MIGSKGKMPAKESIYFTKNQTVGCVIFIKRTIYGTLTHQTTDQFHVRDLFLGKLNSDDDFAERLLNPRCKSILRT